MHAGQPASTSQKGPGDPPAGPSSPAAQGVAEEAEPATPGRSAEQPAEPGGSETQPAEPVTPGRTTDRAEAEASTKDVSLHAELAEISGWSALPRFAAGVTQPAQCAHSLHSVRMLSHPKAVTEPT